jgi:hypothetical protein
LNLTPGKDLSHYRLVEKIGEGGMGVVWRATDTTLGRDVAIKVLPTEFASDPERMARFEREARVLASLNHPGIAAVYGVGSADGVRFLAMEMVEGDDLAARLSQGPMPVVESLETARQIAEALEAAHEKGIVHRDLKPANVKLTADGQVKVLDFGLAKAVAAEARGSGPTSTPTVLPTVTTAGTAMGMILGTAAYMSPEQARGKTVDRRADIWALGCVLYECLTGKRAFDGETASDTLAKVLEREPSFAALPASTPPRVRELLQRCLIKDPKLRLRDIGDARIVLDEILASRTPSGRLLAVDAPAATSAGARRASPLLYAAIGSAGLVLGAAAWALLGPRPDRGDENGTTCVSIAMPPGVSVNGYGLSRDGRTLVVRGQPKKADGTTGGTFRLYARRLDQYDFKELPGTDGQNYFAGIQGDSALYIGAESADSPKLAVLRVPIDGSAPPTRVMDWDVSWTWVVQAPNGDVLGVRGGEFVRVPRGGGAPSAPIKIDAGRPGISEYRLHGTLPGGGGILTDVIAYDSRGWHYSVGVLDPSSGKVRIVEEDGGTPMYSPTGHLLFTRGTTLLAMPFDPKTATPRGAPAAVWTGLSTAFAFVPALFDLSGDGELLYRPGQIGGNRRMAFMTAAGRIEPWGGEPRGVDTGPEVSPDGRRFAVSIANARGIDEIAVSDLDRPGYRRVGTDPNADCTWAQWSPDGRQIAYVRHGRDGRDGVYVQNADGGDARRVYAERTDQERAVPYSWLPDGSALLLSRTSPGQNAIVLLTLAGDPADATRARELVTSPTFVDWPRVSPDGRRVAYTSDESGKTQVYVAELRPDRTLGHSVLIRTNEGYFPVWTRDGKWLFLRDERMHLMKVGVGTVPELTLSTPEDVLDLQALGVSLLTVLPDGRFFVGLRNEDEGDITKLNLVLNWTDELKRRLQAAK